MSRGRKNIMSLNLLMSLKRKKKLVLVLLYFLNLKQIGVDVFYISIFMVYLCQIEIDSTSKLIYI